MCDVDFWGRQEIKGMLHTQCKSLYTTPLQSEYTRDLELKHDKFTASQQKNAVATKILD